MYSYLFIVKSFFERVLGKTFLKKVFPNASPRAL